MYDQLVAAEMIVPQPEKSPPTVPMDYKWAQELGLIRKPAAFMSSICDERGEELMYAGTPISNVFKVCVFSCIVSRLTVDCNLSFVGGPWDWRSAQLTVVPKAVREHCT